jgi:hypothetical protein
MTMPTRQKKKNRKKSVPQPKARLAKGAGAPSVKVRRVASPKPVTDVVTEKTYITTEPEVEIRKPATLAQALTEPAIEVVKPKTKVQRVRESTRHVA